MSRITAPVGEVTTPIVRGRKGSSALAILVEQPLGGERAAALVEQRHQRALPGELHPVDHDLIFGAARIGGELARADHLDPVLGAEAQVGGLPLPHHAVDHRLVVLEREVAMARDVPLPPRNLAAHADMAEAILHRSLERARQFGDRERGRVVAGRLVR